MMQFHQPMALKTVQNFETIGSTLKKKLPGKQRTVCMPEDIDYKNCYAT